MQQQQAMAVHIRHLGHNQTEQLKTHPILILKRPPLPLTMILEQGTIRQGLLRELLQVQNIQKVTQYLQTILVHPRYGVRVREQDGRTCSLGQVHHLLMLRKQNQVIQVKGVNLMVLLIQAHLLVHLRYHQHQPPVKIGKK